MTTPNLMNIRLQVQRTTLRITTYECNRLIGPNRAT